MKARPARPSPRYQALVRLLRTADTIWDGSRVFFAQWDLSPSQFNVLNLLYGNKTGLSQIELSRQLITHRSNLTGLTDRLEKRGLVERKGCPGDRRAYLVVLTAAGAKLMNKVLPEFHSRAEALWHGIEDKTVADLLSALDNVDQNTRRAASDLTSRKRKPS